MENSELQIPITAVPFHFSVASLFASFIFSLVGWYVFKAGRRQADFKLIFIGIGLMIYTYFTSEVWLDWGIGLGLTALAYYLSVV